MRKQTNKFNFNVPKTKLQSRFGSSHSDLRYLARCEAEYFGNGPAPQQSMKYSTKRLQKKCKHTRMFDMGYGGPEGGRIDLYCKDCGYSYSQVLY